MSESNHDIAKKEKASVTRNDTGFMVAPSPFNAVKLDLAIILCLAVLLWLVIGRFFENHTSQFIVLAVFGLSGAVWIIFRTRIILKRAGQQGSGHGAQ